MACSIVGAVHLQIDAGRSTIAFANHVDRTSAAVDRMYSRTIVRCLPELRGDGQPGGETLTRRRVCMRGGAFGGQNWSRAEEQLTTTPRAP